MASSSFLGGLTGGAIGSAVVRLVLDSSQYSSELRAQETATGRSVSTMGGSMLRFKALATTAAVGAAAAFGKFAVDSVRSFEESQNVMAQTEAVIKSTGGAAGLTSKAVSDMAAAFQRSTTYSDEQVQSAENLLLTFTKIGKDIFPQTTQVVLDMSTALGQDLKSSAIQVGKALQDPTVGLTALRRVGVSFTDQQTELIKRLYETGDAARAQQMILDELAKEFGGSATAATKTFAGQMQQLGNQIDDMKEQLGGLIVGGLQPLIPFLQTAIQYAKLLTAVFLGWFAFAKLPAILLAIATGLESIGGAGIVNSILGVSVALEGVAASAALVIALPLAAWFIATAIKAKDAAANLQKMREQILGIRRVQRDAIREGSNYVETTTNFAVALGLANDAAERYGQQAELAKRVTADLQDTFVRGQISRHQYLTDLQLTADVTGQSIDVADEMAAAYDRLGKHVDSTGRIIRNFAGLTGKELKDWRSSVRESVDGVIGDLGQTESVFNTTETNIKKAFDRMAADARRWQTDIHKLLTLKPGTLGLNQQDTEDFKKWLIDRGPQYVDAFVRANADARRKMVEDWQIYTGALQQASGEIKGVTAKMDDLHASIDGLPGSVVVGVGVKVSGDNVLQHVRDNLAAIVGQHVANVLVNANVRYPGIGSAAGGIIGAASGAVLRGATGFVTQRPTYLVGEGGYSTFAGRGAEAVIPLNQRGIDILAEAVRRGMKDKGGVNYITVHAGINDPASVAKQLKAVLDADADRTVLI